MRGRLKRGAAALLAALLLCGSAAAGENVYVLEMERGPVLIDEDGEMLGEAGEYSLLYEVAGLDVKRFAAEKTDGESVGCALLDEQGRPLTGFDYQGFECVSGALIFVRKDYCGAMDENGNILVEADYTALISDGPGGFLAQKTNPFDELADTVYRIAPDGSEVQTGTRITGGMYPMCEGLSAAASAQNALYGYLNAEGEWAIEPKFEWAGMFENGHAVAASAEGTGIIDREGNWVLAPRYISVSRMGDSPIVAADAGGLSVFHPETMQETASFRGNDLYGYPMDGGMALIMNGTQAAVLDGNGEVLCTIDGCVNVSRWAEMGDALIVTKGEYGTPSVYLCDVRGNVLSQGYQEIMPLGEVNGEMHYLFILFEAQKVEYGRGMFFWDEVSGTRVCGVMDGAGRELLRADADYIRYVGGGLLLMERVGGSTLTDMNGNVIREYAAEGTEDEN